MSTLLLSLLLIALIAIGLLMASTRIRESFVNAPSSAPTVIASPVMASLLATPNLSIPTSSQVDTVGRDKDLQNATDAQQPVTSYSAVGPANQPINAMSDLTLFEANYLKTNRAKGNQPLDAPPDSNERTTIAVARTNGATATQNILKGDYSVTENTLTLEEILAIMNARKSTSPQGPPTPTEIATASDMRRTWAAARKANPSGVTMPITGPSSITGPSPMDSRMAVNEVEMSALTAVRKEEAKRKARMLLSQDQENKGMTHTDEYDDDYSEPIRRRRHRRDPEECEQCPDMSQYVKLDEIPCWNCSLP
jgi:hypothetical protein